MDKPVLAVPLPYVVSHFGEAVARLSRLDHAKQVAEMISKGSDVVVRVFHVENRATHHKSMEAEYFRGSTITKESA
jgi:hypothetical protein